VLNAVPQVVEHDPDQNDADPERRAWSGLGKDKEDGYGNSQETKNEREYGAQDEFLHTFENDRQTAVLQRRTRKGFTRSGLIYGLGERI